MDVPRMSRKNPLERHVSSLITFSRIILLKQMLRLHLKATKYSLILHYGISRRTYPQRMTVRMKELCSRTNSPGQVLSAEKWKKGGDEKERFNRKKDACWNGI
jgi:hypothetical protein